MDDDDERPKKERNPFSFKTFIKKKEGGESHEDDDDHLATASGVGSKASTKPHSQWPSTARLKTGLEMEETPFPEVENEAPQKKGKKGNNPFSFSSFVKRETKTKFQPHQSKPKNPKDIFDSSSDSDTEETGPSLAQPLASHMNALFTEQPTAHSVAADSDSFGSDDNEEEKASKRQILFHDDPILNGVDARFSKESETLTSDMKRLRVENEMLTQQVEELKEQLTKEKHRSAKLVEKVKVLKKKEAEETAALENMVQMVEKNLQLTTKRAVKAESEVARLQKDLQSVTAQLTDAGRQKIEETFKSQFALIQDQSQVAAEKMVSAATKAEKSLREIFENVEDLKMASNLMCSVAHAASVAQCRPGNLDDSS